MPDMAETTTATSWPASTSRLTWRATLRMRSMSATDVPPNFITRRAMAGLRTSPAGLGARDPLYGKPTREKAGIHTGEAGGPQPRLGRRSMASKAKPRRDSTRRRGRGRAFLRAGRRVVGPARQDGRAAQVQSGAARLHQGGRLPAVRARCQAARCAVGSAHPRYRLRRRHSERAAGAARRRRRRRRPVADQYRGGAAACRRGRAQRSITARPPPRRWRMPASASTSCSPWRWSSTSPTYSCSFAAARRW